MTPKITQRDSRASPAFWGRSRTAPHLGNVRNYRLPLSNPCSCGAIPTQHIYIRGLKKQLAADHKVTYLTASACPPFLNSDSRPGCRDINDFVFARITEELPDRVILAAVWGNYKWEKLEKTMQGLKKLGIKRIDP